MVMDKEILAVIAFLGELIIAKGYIADGKVTPAGIAELKAKLPWADLTKFEANPRVQDFGDLLTVGDLVRYVESKV